MISEWARQASGPDKRVGHPTATTSHSRLKSSTRKSNSIETIQYPLLQTFLQRFDMFAHYDRCSRRRHIVVDPSQSLADDHCSDVFPPQSELSPLSATEGLPRRLL
ncbi:hypothetical protein CLIM01_13863 [Colletotrichum limetticola]|uniref:Uncharacterized protein n=1 Tax=Colletotrichum limetticola TaxID=1209924 RepID=A0ABQ9PD71_9PEZI|nr:hypothetical protein CLIM01_13863 [Colletotrichum limetticola]